jgi:hypothetical protein
MLPCRRHWHSCWSWPGDIPHLTSFIAVFLEAGNLLFKLLRKPQIIRIQGSNVFPPGPSVWQHFWRSRARIALLDKLDSRIPYDEFFNDGTCGIRGTIINYNDFYRLIRLGKDGIQRLPNVFSSIKRRNNY